MKPRLSKSSLGLALLSIGILFLGFFIYGTYVLKTFRLKFSRSSAPEQSLMNDISKSLDDYTQAIHNGSVSWRNLDRSSIGFPDKEARLVKFRSEVDFFFVSFGHHPSQIGELARLTELPDFPADQRKLVQGLRSECEIINLGIDSYILSCDAFSSLSTTEKEDSVKSFDRGTEKFYNVRGRLILYVPPPTSGKPPAKH